jgi:hypothetical protein
MKMGATGSFRTLVSVYWTARCHNPEDENVNVSSFSNFNSELSHSVSADLKGWVVWHETESDEEPALIKEQIFCDVTEFVAWGWEQLTQSMMTRHLPQSVQAWPCLPSEHPHKHWAEGLQVVESVISLPCPYLYPPYLQADSIILCTARLSNIRQLPCHTTTIWFGLKTMGEFCNYMVHRICVYTLGYIRLWGSMVYSRQEPRENHIPESNHVWVSVAVKTGVLMFCVITLLGVTAERSTI